MRPGGGKASRDARDPYIIEADSMERVVLGGDDPALGGLRLEPTAEGKERE